MARRVNPLPLWASVAVLVAAGVVLLGSHAYMYWVGFHHGNAHGVAAARRDQMLTPQRS